MSDSFVVCDGAHGNLYASFGDGVYIGVTGSTIDCSAVDRNSTGNAHLVARLLNWYHGNQKQAEEILSDGATCPDCNHKIVEHDQDGCTHEHMEGPIMRFVCRCTLPGYNQRPVTKAQQVTINERNT